MRKRGSLAELAFPTWRLLGLRQQTDRTQAPEVRALHVPVRMRDGVDECDVGLQARDVRGVATLFEGVARVCVCGCPRIFMFPSWNQQAPVSFWSLTREARVPVSSAKNRGRICTTWLLSFAVALNMAPGTYDTGVK